jgi:CRP/FNR family transcriptional regulator, nitrogen oxide reductase regulator
MTFRVKAEMTKTHAVSILARVKPPLLDGLSPYEVEMVAAQATIRRFPAHTVITNEADSATHLFLLLEGAARGFVLTARGDKIGLGWFPSRTMGLAALVSRRIDYVVSMETFRSSSVLAWDRATIRALAITYPLLLENALTIAYDYVVLYRTLHLTALCDSAEQRLAQVLGQLAKGIGNPVANGFELRINNEELAHEAHVTPFTVSRQMQKWQRQGLVKKVRGGVIVCLPDQLLRVAT